MRTYSLDESRNIDMAFVLVLERKKNWWRKTYKYYRNIYNLSHLSVMARSAQTFRAFRVVFDMLRVVTAVVVRQIFLLLTPMLRCCISTKVPSQWWAHAATGSG